MSENKYQVADLPLRFDGNKDVSTVVNLERLQSYTGTPDYLFLDTKMSTILLRNTKCAEYLYKVRTFQHRQQKDVQVLLLEPIQKIESKLDHTGFLQDFHYMAPVDDQSLIEALKQPKPSISESDLQRCEVPPNFLKHYNWKIPKVNVRTLTNTPKGNPQPVNQPHLVSIDYDQSAVQDQQNPLVPIELIPLYDEIKYLFERQPIWLRNSLMFNLKQSMQTEINGQAFKKCICNIAYCYKRGPWMHCYVKFGYKPKQTEEAARYQSFEIANSRFLDERTYANPKNQYDPTLKDTPVNYRNKYQFCDIDDEPFQRRFQDYLQHLNNECTLDYGWFTKIQHRTLLKMAKQKMTHH